LLIDSLRTTLAISAGTTQYNQNYLVADGLSKLKLQQVREFINENLHQEIKLIKLAAIAQSVPIILRLFKQLRMLRRINTFCSVGLRKLNFYCNRDNSALQKLQVKSDFAIKAT